jgi:predicted cupin superfamily sugar epimerase
MVVCSPDGKIGLRRLGTDIRAGCQVQALVPGGRWQGTLLDGVGDYGYALLGTTMTPGFRADQLTMATEDDLDSFADEVAHQLRPFLASNQPAHDV